MEFEDLLARGVNITELFNLGWRKRSSWDLIAFFVECRIRLCRHDAFHTANRKHNALGAVTEANMLFMQLIIFSHCLDDLWVEQKVLTNNLNEIFQ